MKKFLSLTLVAVMLLSTLMLTSCDIFNTVSDFVGDLFGGDEEKDVRTTITEEEWLKAWETTNYTFKLESDGSYMFVETTGEIAKIRTDIEGLYSISAIRDLKTGVMVYESSIGWIGCTDDASGDYDMSLAGIGFVIAYEFSDLTYDESKKAYVVEEEYSSSEFYFEDGKLVYIKEVPTNGETEGLIEVTNIGTTVVNLPTYSILNDGKVDPSTAPEGVRTTITAEDLVKHLDLRNFTINVATASYSEVVSISLKVNSKGVELEMDSMYEAQNQYIAIFNGEFYPLEEDANGNYVASESLGTMAELEELLAEAKTYLTTIEGLYNEEGRYYTLDVDGQTIYAYFENGQLVKVVVTMEEYEGSVMEVVFVVSDIGTTKVELPTYSIVK